jgi:hypothetical protein
MPFKSEDQRRWMYANKPEMAKEWEEETPKGKKLPKKFKGVENKEYHQAMIGLRRSSAASPQDNRPNRQRSRADSLRAAVKRSRDEE